MHKMLQLKVTKSVAGDFFLALSRILKPSGTESKLWHWNLKGRWGLKVRRWIKTAWSCSPWTCQLQPTSLKWERGERGEEWVSASGDELKKKRGGMGKEWGPAVCKRRKCRRRRKKKKRTCLLPDLALAGSPRWSECTSEPLMAAPQNSGRPRCCSTSRAASRIPPSPASKRPCWLQWEDQEESWRQVGHFFDSACLFRRQDCRVSRQISDIMTDRWRL